MKEETFLNMVLGNWVAFINNTPKTWPSKYGRHLVWTSDEKAQWELWNGTTWAYNHNDIKYYCEIILSDIIPPEKIKK